MEIKKQKTRTIKAKMNGRSADYTSANFIYGCLAKCQYCYIRRNPRLYDTTYVNTNYYEICNQVLELIVYEPWPKIPNQTDDIYYTVDICCNTDLCLMWKYTDWTRILRKFEYFSRTKATFATKYPSRNKFIPTIQNKTRIRISLMPEKYRKILEPYTDSIDVRIEQIQILKDLGYDVHINFSPIIYEQGWLKEYEDLFKKIPKVDYLKSENIFMTYNKEMFKRQEDIAVKDLLWKPYIQEDKVSKYGSQALRYKWKLKKLLIHRYKQVYNDIIPHVPIRYIF